MTGTPKAFDSTKVILDPPSFRAPESTADPFTIYIEILKDYLAFFLPSEGLDYEVVVPKMAVPSRRHVLSPRPKGDPSAPKRLLGRSWNIFVAK
jgi:hypothetical protein